MKKVWFALSFVLFISCDCEHQKPSKVCVQPEIEQVAEDNIQYHIKWGNNNVDVRIVTLEKNGIKHDYVVATSYGSSIEHWEGCDCKK